MAEIKYPTGYSSTAGNTKLAINFPTVLFDAVLEMAKHEKKTFNAMVIELIKVGKMDLDESDALESTAHNGVKHDA